MTDELLRCRTWIRVEGAVTEVCRCILVREHGHTAHKFNIPGDVTKGIVGQVRITQLDDAS